MDGPVGVTLRVVERFGAWCARYRIGAAASTVVSTILLLTTVLGGTTESAWSLLALSLVLWSMILLGAGYALPRLPLPVALSEGLLRWLGHWVALAAFTLGALVLLGLAGFATFLGFRALGLIVG